LSDELGDLAVCDERLDAWELGEFISTTAAAAAWDFFDVFLLDPGDDTVTNSWKFVSAWWAVCGKIDEEPSDFFMFL
jgi:hypothetical protein